MGFFLSYFYNRWAQISTVATGAKAGASFGLFLSLTYGFFKMAIESSLTTELFTLDVAISIGITAINGAVIGGINIKIS